MQLEFQLTKADLIEANKFFWRHASGKDFNRKAFALGIALLAVSMAVSNFLSGYWGMVGMMIGMIIGLALILLFVKTLPKKFDARNPAGALAPQKQTVGASGFSIKTKYREENLKWAYFLGFEETRSLFVLIIEPNRANIIPKRAFKDEAQMEEFRKLCREKIPASA